MDTIRFVCSSKYKCSVNRFFELCSWDKFKFRCFQLLFVTPELFLSGFLWSGFSYACGYNTDSVEFYFSTGFGSGLGALVGHLLGSITISESGYPTVPRIEVFHSLAYFLAIFFGSGTTWQRIVNDTKDYGMGFNSSLFFMWSMSTLLFITIITMLRFINLNAANFFIMEHFYFERVKVKKRFLYDVQMALSVGLADAFFVGTMSGYYANNWLGPAFGIQTSTPVWEGMLKSGASTVCGFLLCQTVQNVISKDNWIDHLVDEVEEDTLLTRLSDMSLVAMPQPGVTRNSLMNRMSITPNNRGSANFSNKSFSGSLSFSANNDRPTASVDSLSGGPETSLTPFATVAIPIDHPVVSPLQPTTTLGSLCVSLPVDDHSVV